MLAIHTVQHDSAGDLHSVRIPTRVPTVHVVYSLLGLGAAQEAGWGKYPFIGLRTWSLFGLQAGALFSFLSLNNIIIIFIKLELHLPELC